MQGGADVALVADRRGTRLDRLDQRAPWRVLFPRPPSGDPFAAVIANTGGGIAGGDRARLSVSAGPGVTATVTTQAAEKVYRSSGSDSEIETSVTVATGAFVEWVPQETILFDGARLRRRIAFDVAPGGLLLAAEILVYGRVARGERFSYGRLLDQWRVRRGGNLVWADGLGLDGDIPARMAAPAGFGDARASATVVLVGDSAADWLGHGRALTANGSTRAAATVVNGVLLIRSLGPDPRTLRNAVGETLGALRASAGGFACAVPRLWQI